jgi:hypothetical protein
MDAPKTADITKLIDLHAKSISCLARGAVPNVAMVEGMQDQINSMLWLLDELISVIETGDVRAPVAKVH